MNRIIAVILASAVWLLAGSAWADPAPFDLSGPNLRVTVTRAGVTLPIGAVPQLAVGDKVKVEAVMPADETAHYILVSAFLRDPTNPPPANWFGEAEIWKRRGRAVPPINLTIPASAQHLVLFLAPATGGDFGTLRGAVLARPGAFVRAAQDLEQASLDRSRYDAYLAAIEHVSATSPATLVHVAPVVADSLHIKINQDCLQRQPEFQAACLLDSKQAAVLGADNTSGSNAMTGAATDLALNLSATPAGGLGYYSPYIGVIRDIVGIFGAMHTAKYQYIPALGVAKNDLLALVLNTPPSFANPKSVLMAALPSIKSAHMPTLQIAAASPACLGADQSLLRLMSDPLIYATGYAHDLVLRVAMPGSETIDLPLLPDVARGGLTIGASDKIPPHLAGPITGTIHGQWGFDPFVGPEVSLQTAGDWQWKAGPPTKAEGTLTLVGASPACVAHVTATPPHGSAQPLVWKDSGAHDIAVTLPAAGEKPEPVTISIVGPRGTDPATVVVAPPTRLPPPAVTIVAHSSEPMAADKIPAVAITLAGADQIPADVGLNFTLKTNGNEHFNGHDQVEVATANGDAPARLTLGNGLTLVDAGVMVATLNPAQALGMSAFGPLRARLMRNGVAGEWLGLGTLVRMPRLKQVVCPQAPAAPCTLSGEGLFLLASVSATPDFDSATSVAEGYPGFTLAVPHPAGNVLYVRLHDAPEQVNELHFQNVTAR